MIPIQLLSLWSLISYSPYQRFKGKALAKALTPVELVSLLESDDHHSTFDTENVITDAQLEQLLDRTELWEMMEKKAKEKKDRELGTSEHGGVETSCEGEEVGDEEEVNVGEVTRSESNKLFTVVETTHDETMVFW